MRGAVLPVLVVVLGAGAGCGRPNPGFGVAPEPESGSTSGGSTGGSTSGAPVVTTGGESTGELTGSTSVGSTSGESTSEGGSTGAVEVVWPTDCAERERVRTRAGKAAADTFLLNLPEGGGECFGVDQDCADVSLGKMPTYAVYYTDSGDQVTPDQEFGGVFAARFAGPLSPVYGDEELPVPEDAFLGVEVSVTVARSPNNLKEWEPVEFRVFRMGEGDSLWEEGNNSVLAACGAGEPSFHCQGCGGDLEMPWQCATPWVDPMGLPFVKEMQAAAVQLTEDPGAGAELVISLEQDWEWLLQDGFVLVPGPKELMLETVEVRAREYEMGAAGPFIAVVHCPPEFV